jgi:hypothetical protein
MSQEVVLTTNQMAFFIYNLIGHDISHDGHPSGGFINNDGKYLIAIRTIARRGGNISKKNKKTVKNKGILKNKKIKMLQNIEKQNIEKQNIEKQNIEKQNIDTRAIRNKYLILHKIKYLLFI